MFAVVLVIMVLFILPIMAWAVGSHDRGNKK